MMMIARLTREQRWPPAISRQPLVDRHRTLVAGDAGEYEERHVRCSGASGGNRGRRWVTMMITVRVPPAWQRATGPPSSSSQSDRPFFLFARPSGPYRKPGTAHPGLKSVPCKNLRTAGCSRERVSLAIPKNGPHGPHQASSWSAVPGGLQGGRWVRAVPMGPQGRKKSLDPAAGEKKWPREVLGTYNGNFLRRGRSTGSSHIGALPMPARDLTSMRDYERRELACGKHEPSSCLSSNLQFVRYHMIVPSCALSFWVLTSCTARPTPPP